MSLPSQFDQDAVYFSAVVDFLHTYAWIYREPNTNCLKALDCMPADFIAYFSALSNENLNKFPFVQEETLQSCPESVQNFRQQLAKLIPTATAPLPSTMPPSKPNNCNRRMNFKKLHEIEQLASHIHSHVSAMGTQLLIDLGSGLGYLSEALLRLNDNYMILGLEADESRVESAKSRSQKLLPQETTKSISYKAEFITADAECRARIEGHAQELGNSRGFSTTPPTSLIGLHACADLSISAMILFLTMPQVRSLHIMPCCYHKLQLREVSHHQANESCFVHFPLSRALRGVFSAAGDAIDSFQRPFMRLACQETNSRWRSDAAFHAQHGRLMFLRALAQSLCDDDELRYQLHSRQTGQAINWRSIHQTRFDAINAKYPDAQGYRLAEALCCLQASLQKLCENLVLYDRLCYLKDAAEEQQLPVELRYEQLFDEQVSPRCQVLIAKKL